MKIYALSSINHDGKLHAAGQGLDVSTEQAESLIELGYATKTKPEKSSDKSAEKSTDKPAEKDADKPADPQADLKTDTEKE
jgi:hypothetical protein